MIQSISDSLYVLFGILNDFSDAAGGLLSAIRHTLVLGQAVASAFAEEHHLKLERGHDIFDFFLFFVKAFGKAFGIGGVLAEAGFEEISSFGIGQLLKGFESIGVVLHGCFNDLPDFRIHLIKIYEACNYYTSTWEIAK